MTGPTEAGATLSEDEEAKADNVGKWVSKHKALKHMSNFVDSLTS